MRSLLALSLVAAGLLHVALTGEHYEESAILGTGFLVAGIAQAALGLLVLRTPRPTVYSIVVALNAVLVALYIAHVTVGLPLGGKELSVEEIALSGLATKALELVGVATALGLLARRRPAAHIEDLVRQKAA